MALSIVNLSTETASSGAVWTATAVTCEVITESLTHFSHTHDMTEKAEAWRVPANILRTVPYTAYTATLGYGIIFAHAPALHLFGALILNELSNHAAKARRPPGPVPMSRNRTKAFILWAQRFTFFSIARRRARSASPRSDSRRGCRLTRRRKAYSRAKRSGSECHTTRDARYLRFYKNDVFFFFLWKNTMPRFSWRLLPRNVQNFNAKN